MKTSESVAKFMFLFHEKVKEKNALYIKQLIKNLIGIVINRMEDIIDRINHLQISLNAGKEKKRPRQFDVCFGTSSKDFAEVIL